jgi:hypothetical protein
MSCWSLDFGASYLSTGGTGAGFGGSGSGGGAGAGGLGFGGGFSGILLFQDNRPHCSGLP